MKTEKQIAEHTLGLLNRIDPNDRDGNKKLLPDLDDALSDSFNSFDKSTQQHILRSMRADPILRRYGKKHGYL